MTNGPTLGNAPEQEIQKLYDAMQVHIADMGDDKRLSGLLMDFGNTGSGLRMILGDLNAFSDEVKAGKSDTDQIVSALQDIAEKAFRELGKMRDEDLQRKGTDYQAARWAFLKHFYSIARTFGAQVEIGRILDKWEKEHPHTDDPKEQTYQEQKEAALKLVEARFPTMYGEVTSEVGYDPDKVLEASMTYIDERLVGDQDGPMACYYGVAYSSKWNTTSGLSEAEKTKRVEILKAKLRPMVLEAITKDARRATKVVFEALSSEMYPDASSLRGKTASVIADDMITHVIRKRCKSNDVAYSAYKPLAHYWNNDPDKGGSVLELRQNLIYLIKTQWGSELASDAHADNQAERASKRIEGNRQYFAGNVAPVAAASVQEAVPSAVSSSTTGQQLVASGEGTGIIDLASMQAELASKVANESQQQSGYTVIKPGRVPAPSPSQSVIIDPSIPTEDPNSRRTKTVPPAAPRPQRPDITIASRPDQETTQMDARKVAQARNNKVTKWFKRGLLAVAAALGIAGGVTAYKAYQPAQSDNQKDTSSEVAKQNAANTTPSATSAAEAPSVSATPAPTVALNPTAAPTAAPTDSAEPAPVAVPPTVTNPPKSVETAKVATVIGSHSYGMGSSTGAAPFTGTASLVEGGVDATPFVSTLKTATWYETQQKSAETLMKIYDTNKSQLDKDTASYIATHEATLRDLASQTDFTPYKFRTGFEKRHNVQELFSASGVYNTLLAFERIVDLYGNDTAKLLKDAPTIKLTVGSKLNAPEQRFAKAVLLTASADPATAPNPQGAPDGNGQPQKAPTDDNNGKSGFNDYTPGFNGGANAPNVIPANVVVPGQNVQYAMEAESLQSDNLDVAFNAFNTSARAKAADKREVRDYRVAREVQRHVAAENQKIVDFEQKRKSRGFFTKLADFGRNIWSGTTPEDREQGLRGIGGIRGFFMSDSQRQAEFQKRADMIEAMERRAVKTAKAPVQKVVASNAPVQAALSLAQMTKDIETSYASDLVREAEEKRKIAADLEKSRLDVEASYKADLARESAERKAVLRSELDKKMEKLFAKGKLMEAERGPLPAVDFRKTYKVAKEDRSIKFVLERQIKLSDLSDEAKEKSLDLVQEMIRTNGAFIETYKMHADGSRDLTLKDEWRDKLKEAAGIKVAAAPASTTSTQEEIADNEKIAKAA